MAYNFYNFYKTNVSKDDYDTVFEVPEGEKYLIFDLIIANKSDKNDVVNCVYSIKKQNGTYDDVVLIGNAEMLIGSTLPFTDKIVLPAGTKLKVKATEFSNTLDVSASVLSVE